MTEKQIDLLNKTVSEEQYLVIQEIKRCLYDVFKEHYNLNDEALKCFPIDNLSLTLFGKLETRLKMERLT